MRFDVISLFPDMVQQACQYGVTGRALERGLAKLVCWNPRDETEDVHRTVDDRPYGGGPGMVMMAEPLDRTLSKVQQQVPNSPVIYLSPQGKPMTQALLRERLQTPGMVLICGRYEGIDDRFVDARVDEEWSLGDFVLSGGEIGAIAVIDAMSRLIPGALGDEQSADQDSFMDGLLDCPHFTRPEVWQDKKAPSVLLSGHHEQIRQWRLQQSLGRTWLRRPDLLEKRVLNDEEQSLLDEFIKQQDLKITGQSNE
ncbi:MAG: tRNA (guanosine(37)-N1)-methyltransferase TrmD [Gammaproteobacteria bacterium]|nr:MAG: tRNA (guanosine(37)-N1)-methyltransferase TrmD [Gammaproteobacteria bacterium]